MSRKLLKGLFLLLSINFATCYKILILSSGMSSHRMFFSHLGRELIKHGHDVVLPVGEKEIVISEIEVGICIFIHFATAHKFCKLFEEI